MTQENQNHVCSLENEIWKPVKGYQGYYEISNFGRVKSVDRIIKNNYCGTMHVAEKIKSTTIAATGYPCVTLCRDRKSKQVPIHRLLMEAFVPKPSGKNYIDHINTIKTDNRLCNLRWVTPKENSNNPITLQRFKKDANSEEQKAKRLRTRAKNGGKTAPIKVYQYTKNGKFILEYPSTTNAQKVTGIYSTAIRVALDDNTQTAGGFMWFTSPQNNPKYERKLPKNAKPVIQYDMQGNKIQEFKSLTEASRKMHIDINTIPTRIKMNMPFNGYMYKYKVQ